MGFDEIFNDFVVNIMWCRISKECKSSFKSEEDRTKVYKDRYEGVTEEIIKKAMEGKTFILIGDDKYHTYTHEKYCVKEMADTLNHEEFHAESTLEGNSGPEKNSDENEGYYGEKRDDSPKGTAVKVNSKYAKTIVKEQMYEIYENSDL